MNAVRYVINKIPRMDWGNWLFWSVVVWIGFNLIWIGAVSEHAKAWIGAIIATLLAAAVYKFGPRIKEEEAGEGE